MFRFFLVLLLLAYYPAEAGFIVHEAKYIAKHAVPVSLRKSGADLYMVRYSCSNAELKTIQQYSKNDSVINVQKLIKLGYVVGYRAMWVDYYDQNCAVQKLVEFDASFQPLLTAKPEQISNAKFDLVETTSLMPGGPYKSRIPSILCKEEYSWAYRHDIFSEKDLADNRMPVLWVLSIGIDDYKNLRHRNCKTDAISYSEFLTRSFASFRNNAYEPGSVRVFTLLDKDATKDSILGSLKKISSSSSPGDYFVFTFSGQSIENGGKNGKPVTHFVPYGISYHMLQNNIDLDRLISLSQIKEYLEFMPARNQLFITESGPTETFRQEFISTLMENNPGLSDILNKNRVIIVPTTDGSDEIHCKGVTINKGPLNHYITSLPDSINIFDLFSKENIKRSSVSHQLLINQFHCPVKYRPEYFSIFFERDFLEIMRSLAINETGMRSSRKGSDSKETKTGYGKKYALVIGTDTYKASSEWSYLPNAVYDAKEVAAELVNNYGYEVDTIYNPSMNEIYEKLWSYSSKLGSSDQFLLYVSGHGDFDSIFLDDGVIVCSDSRERSQDKSMNTYIPYAKLERILNRMPTKHMLLMLDVCFGGSFGTGMTERNSNEIPVYSGMSVDEIVSEKSKLRTRRSISSGKGKVPDGYAGLHSPFAYFLLEILRGKGGSNGYFTATQIYSRMQSALKSKPIFISFGNNEAGSDFIFEYTPKK